MVTTIQLNENVKNALDRLKTNKETYEEIILKLMQIAEKQKREQEELLIEGCKEMYNDMLEIKKGDILLVNFEPVRGSEQGRIRPALVIQNNILNKFSPLTIVAPITSKVYEKEYPTNIFIRQDDSVLNTDSTVLLNQIRTI